jgi:hypothetical protein
MGLERSVGAMLKKGMADKRLWTLNRYIQNLKTQDLREGTDAGDGAEPSPCWRPKGLGEVGRGHLGGGANTIATYWDEQV